MSICATTVESLDQATTSLSQRSSRDLQMAFACTLISHGTALSALLPGCTLPQGHIYPLSHAETESMEVYVQEVLAQGFLLPSTSPAAYSLFFVKVGGLRPCIDYRTLNKATVKFTFPLPLIPTLIEQMHDSKYFTKFDLHSA